MILRLFWPMAVYAQRLLQDGENAAVCRRSDERGFAAVEYLDNCRYNFSSRQPVGQGADEGIRLIASMMNQCMFSGQRTTVLLETMAGKGTEVGRSFEELAAIIDKVQFSDKVGVCLDTCPFDGGYDITERLDEVLEQFDRLIGLERLKAVHINDSKNPWAAAGTGMKKSAKVISAWRPFGRLSTIRPCGRCRFIWKLLTS